MADMKKIEDEIDFTLLGHEIDKRLKKMSLSLSKKDKKNITHSKNVNSTNKNSIYLKRQGKVETISINSCIKKIVINLT